MNRMGYKVLACPAFSTKKNRCVAVGYLLNKPINPFHCVTCADHVVYIEMIFQLPAQAHIFFTELHAVGFHKLVQLDRLGHHRGDDVKQPDIGVKVIFRIGLLIDTHCADRFAFQLYRDAEKSNLLALLLLSRLCFMQETRIFRNVRHDSPTL